MPSYDEHRTSTGVEPRAGAHVQGNQSLDQARGGQQFDTTESDFGKLEDYGYLMEVCRGDKESVASLLRIFIHSASGDLSAWQAACNDGNWPLARKLSHRLRSGFHQLGEIGISRCLAEIESGDETKASEADLGAMCRDLLPLIHSAMAKAEMGARSARKQ